jgi:hypothetical protein
MPAALWPWTLRYLGWLDISYYISNATETWCQSLLEVLSSDQSISASIQDKNHLLCLASTIDQCIIYILPNFVWNGHILLVIMNFHFHPMVRTEALKILKMKRDFWWNLTWWIHNFCFCFNKISAKMPISEFLWSVPDWICDTNMISHHSNLFVPNTGGCLACWKDGSESVQ